MKVSVGIINSKVGNLQNVRKALSRFATDYVLVDEPEQLKGLNKLVLPGVGAFAAGMSVLRERSLDQAICEYARSGKDLLGICLGMQMLLTTSYEFGEHAGLGIIAGEVRQLPRDRTTRITPEHSAVPLKVPHVGWDDVRFLRSDSSLGIEAGTSAQFYFTHSFGVYPQSADVVLGECDSGYGPFCAMLSWGSILGCQFHVELSSESGLNILSHFLAR